MAKKKNPAAVALGSMRTAKKSAASRKNAAKATEAAAKMPLEARLARARKIQATIKAKKKAASQEP